LRNPFGEEFNLPAYDGVKEKPPPQSNSNSGITLGILRTISRMCVPIASHIAATTIVFDENETIINRTGELKE